jgi:hypothetical protein
MFINRLRVLLTMNEQKSLSRILFTWSFSGALFGTGAGSALEDILQHVSTDPFIDYTSWGTACVGTVISAAIGLTLYYNRDADPGKVVLAPKQPVKQQTVRPGIDTAIYKLTYGITNTCAITYFTRPLLRGLNTNPLDELRREYESAQDKFWLNQFEVFEPFTANKTRIIPKKALEGFFDNGDILYNSARDYIARRAQSIAGSRERPFNTRREHEQWSEKFKEGLFIQFRYAQEISIWITYLSHRGGIVGSQVESKLRNYGITRIDDLARDVTLLGNNILKAYDKLCREQLALYHK